MLENFDYKLQKYAELLVKVWINLQPGQQLLVRASIETAPLVEKVTACAYQAGARLVTVVWSYEPLELARFRYAPRDSFQEFPTWITEGYYQHVKAGNALLNIYAEDPDLLKGQDPELIGISMQARVRNMAPVSNLISSNATNWNIVSYPIPSWARKIFPGLPDDQAVQKLWEAIFDICRINTPDPVAAWQEHVEQLVARATYMNNKAYTALKYTGPGTDLTVGLPKGHIWRSAGFASQTGIPFIANVPTEEIFTLPHKAIAEGTVRASMPLNYGSTLIEEFSLTLSGGKVVKYQASRGEELLKSIFATDEGSARFGEVALVPFSSPISQSKLLFYNTLFDENAASHIALGRAYRFSLAGGVEMTEEEFGAAGGNYSLNHIDFMIGSGEMDLDGITESGKTEPVMRQGEWAFAV
jgi:aminopeptidase